MIYSNEQLEKIKMWFVMGYSARDVATLMLVDKREFINDVENNVQGLNDLKEHSNLVLDSKKREKLINKIKAKQFNDEGEEVPGDLDLKAVKELNNIIKESKIKEIKNELFGL